MAPKFSRPSGFLSYGSKKPKCCLDQELKIKSPLAYLTFDAIFLIPWIIFYKMHNIIFQKVLILLR